MAPALTQSTARPSRTYPQSQPQSQDPFPAEKIKLLVDLGATREQAIELLRSADGNVDIAASFLFG